MPLNSDNPRARVRRLFTLTPENSDYVDEKGMRFQRGGRGGNSEALNRMIKFVREYEERMEKDA